jgi:hypothetical protein
MDRINRIFGEPVQFTDEKAVAKLIEEAGKINASSKNKFNGS